MKPRYLKAYVMFMLVQFALAFAVGFAFRLVAEVGASAIGGTVNGPVLMCLIYPCCLVAIFPAYRWSVRRYCQTGD